MGSHPLEIFLGIGIQVLEAAASDRRAHLVASHPIEPAVSQPLEKLFEGDFALAERHRPKSGSTRR